MLAAVEAGVARQKRAELEQAVAGRNRRPSRAGSVGACGRSMPCLGVPTLQFKDAA